MRRMNFLIGMLLISIAFWGCTKQETAAEKAADAANKAAEAVVDAANQAADAVVDAAKDVVDEVQSSTSGDQ